MVKCQDCGYLTFRHRESRSLDEAEDRMRFEGQFPVLRGQSYTYERTPLCFVQAQQLVKEIRAFYQAEGQGLMDASLSARDPGPDAIVSVVSSERECPEFRQWRQGFTPKEHVETREREVRERREDQRDAAQRDWQATQEQRAEERHQQLLDAARSSLMWDVVVVGVIATVVLASATIVGAVIQSGVWTLPWAD